MGKEDLFSQAESLIAELKEDCKSESIAGLESILSDLGGLCEENAEDKPGTFEDAAKLLDAVEVDCPNSKDVVDQLRDILSQGQAIECGGP